MDANGVGLQPRSTQRAEHWMIWGQISGTKFTSQPKYQGLPVAPDVAHRISRAFLSTNVVVNSTIGPSGMAFPWLFLCVLSD
jgi:hypothetical protein